METGFDISFFHIVLTILNIVNTGFLKIVFILFYYDLRIAVISHAKIFKDEKYPKTKVTGNMENVWLVQPDKCEKNQQIL